MSPGNWSLPPASRLQCASPEQLALNSTAQYLRIAQPVAGSNRQPGPGPEPAGPEADDRRWWQATAAHRRGGAAVTYRVHEIVLSNKSLTDRDSREKLMQLLSELADIIEPTSGKDVQVATIKIELNAAAGALDSAEEKARAIGASWAAHEEDF